MKYTWYGVWTDIIYGLIQMGNVYRLKNKVWRERAKVRGINKAVTISYNFEGLVWPVQEILYYLHTI